ncbi:hypothetical protein ABI59_12365 [Acidobacteria bacterium Mor1]|nr:hypothetical protein ABI59_12365 [Acidobacteria bacterium Mor1]
MNLRSRWAWGLALGFVLLQAALLEGRPVPSVNEPVYLARLVADGNPGFLPGDWTFAAHDAEHFLFNLIFAPLTRLIPIEALAWLGRFACWLAVCAGAFRLARKLELSPLVAAVGLTGWLAIGQSFVAGSWMVGGFESKCVAYALLLFSMCDMLDRRHMRGAALLGGVAAFHAAVGLWGGVAIAALLLTQRLPVTRLLTMAALTVAVSLPGSLPLMLSMAGGGAGAADWGYQVTVRMPHHLDPASWPLRYIIGLFSLFAFNLLCAWSERDREVFRGLAAFETALASAFMGGLLCRAVEAWDLLRLFPFRLFAVFTPLLFAFWLARRLTVARPRFTPAVVAAGIVALLWLPNPFLGWMTRAHGITQEWRAERRPDPLHEVMGWVAGNTPADAVAIAPPFEARWALEARRSSVGSWKAIRYDDLPGWEARMRGLLGGELPADRRALPDRYRAMSIEQARELARRYGATVWVVDAERDLPLLHRSGRWNVYALGSADLNATAP